MTSRPIRYQRLGESGHTNSLTIPILGLVQMSPTTTPPSSSGGENKTTSPIPLNLNSLSLSSSLSSPSLSFSSAMDENLPLQKVSISGPTISSLINRFSSAPSNIEGVLFGKFSLLPPSLTDDDTDISNSQSTLTAVITSFISGDVTTLLRRHDHRHVIGWFSGRRRSPLRPSLREFAICHSLSSESSRIFLLLTTPSQESSQTLIHTHDYKVFQFVRRSTSFDAVKLDVVNIGPAFRGHYGAFSPNSEIPWLPCEFPGGSPMREDTKKVAKESKEQLASYADDFDGLSRLMGSDAVNYMSGVEEFYEKMLGKLDCLARQVETSSAKVLEMENHNMKLRHRVAGLE